MPYQFDWKKRALYLGYGENNKYPCYLTDSMSPYSPYFNITGLKEILSGGKNLFKINPSENVLQIGTEVLVEIADHFGNALYCEVTGLIQEQYHLVTIWVYSDYPSSQITLTILGTATRKMDGRPLTKPFKKGDSTGFPDGTPWWNGKPSINRRVESARPNIRYQKTLFVDPSAPNTEPVLFSFMPKVKLGEKIRTWMSQSYETGRISSSIQSMSYDNDWSSTWPADPLPEEARDGPNFMPRLISPTPFFSSSMAGSTIKFEADLINGTDPSINAANLRPGESLTYETHIHSVINSTRARLSTPYQAYTDEVLSSKGSPTLGYIQLNKPAKFDLSVMQITHSNPPIYIDTENSESYAVCNFKNFSPICGDVHRIVTKIKSHGTVGDWEIIGDNILEATELMADTGSATMRTRWGDVDNDNVVSAYWEVTAHEGALVPSMSRADNILVDALNISMSGDINSNKYVKVSTKHEVEFNKGSYYTLYFKSFLKRTPDSSTTSGYDPLSVKVFLSGSGFTNVVGDPDPTLGLYIGDLYSNAPHTQEFISSYTFQATKDGWGKPYWKIEAACEMHIAEASLKAETDSGFTPEQFQLINYVPTKHNNDLLDFRFELYNPDNIKASIDLEYDAVSFAGGNLFITDALLSGQMDVGPDVASAGLQVGGNASAYLRTINPTYPGFHSASAGSGSGILLWSGSLGETLYEGSGDDYKGIGMELVLDSSSYFRFRTDPSELDIRAQRFFVGTQGEGSNGQFISGALGSIEISSSKFHLKPDGDVIMKGQITAEAGGTIGGWAIGDTFLSSSNIILSSSGTMQSGDFESSLLGAGVGKGWRITGGGEAEFENAKIRGTLRTAVFEKDTISAVGGAVIIANATVTTGSDVLSSSMNGNVYGVPSASIPVESVGGFTAGEYLICKSIEDAGFTNELMKVYSSSILPATLHVSRALNDNTVTTMSAAQVIVSYASLNQGFIFMNATSGSDTPFIDIMERTGSGHYDIETKVRLGDLSGLNASKVGSNPGHGLFGENVFLTGKLEASVLSGQVVTIDDSNFTTYLSSSIAGAGYTLVLDGTAGGKQTLNVVIASTNSVDPLVIKGILAPDVTNAVNVDVNIEIAEEITAVITIDPDAGGVAGATMTVNTNRFWSAVQSNAIQFNCAAVAASSPGV